MKSWHSIIEHRNSHYYFAVLFFLLLTALLHHQILAALNTRVLAGHQVGGYYCWLFWHYAQALINGTPLLHTSMMMYPTGLPLFPQSPLIVTVAVMMQTVMTPYAAYNILQLLTYILSAVAAYYFFFHLTKDKLASLCAAFTYAFSEYMIIQHYHGQIIEAALYFNPLFALFLLRLAESPSRRNTILAGATLIGVILSGPYVAFSFAGVFISGWLLYDCTRKHSHLKSPHFLRSFLIIISAAISVALIVYWPLISRSSQWIGAHSFYALSLAAFFDPPFWHSWPWVQDLRPLGGAAIAPERTMGYLGLAGLVSIATALWLGSWKDERIRMWTWLALFSAILTLGPTLSLTPATDTGIPLPYALIAKLPLLSSFRNSARIMMTTSLAFSTLTALSLAMIFSSSKPRVRSPLCLLFILFTFFEFDLGVIGTRFVSSKPSKIYQTIAKDKDDVAILELPLSYDKNGNLLIHAQYYLLFQPHHKKPMVLGYPSRHLRSSLEFTERADVVRELTHPWLLTQLDTDPKHRQRRNRLIRDGAKILKDNGIRYVIFHSELPVYDARLRHTIQTWLESMLGRPILADNGQLLYKV